MMLEDDSDDRYLTNETLSDLDITVPIKFFSSSKTFFDFLSVSEKPSLILIDYNLTPENGVAILKRLKAHPSFYEIPVVILSDNDYPKFKKECYLNGASSFIKKPGTLEATRQKIATFFKYWFDVVEV